MIPDKVVAPVGVVAAAGSVALIYLLLAYVFGWSGRLVF